MSEFLAGDTINTASRIQSVAPQKWASPSASPPIEATRDASSTTPSCRPATLKGKAEPVRHLPADRHRVPGSASTPTRVLSSAIRRPVGGPPPSHRPRSTRCRLDCRAVRFVDTRRRTWYRARAVWSAELLASRSTRNRITRDMAAGTLPAVRRRRSRSGRSARSSRRHAGILESDPPDASLSKRDAVLPSARFSRLAPGAAAAAPRRRVRLRGRAVASSTRRGVGSFSASLRSDRRSSSSRTSTGRTMAWLRSSNSWPIRPQPSRRRPRNGPAGPDRTTTRVRFGSGECFMESISSRWPTRSGGVRDRAPRRSRRPGPCSGPPWPGAPWILCSIGEVVRLLRDRAIHASEVEGGGRFERGCVG